MAFEGSAVIIHLDRITDEPFAWEETLAVSAASLDRDELVELGEVSCRGRVSKVTDGFLFAARLSYEQVLSCVRCLDPIADPVECDVELLISPKAARPTAGEHELSEKELGLLFVDGEELDTRPILLEQLQLNIPMRKLCRPDCAGLCPTCGANRNAQPCGCEEVAVDPRWQALRALSQPTEKN